MPASRTRRQSSIQGTFSEPFQPYEIGGLYQLRTVTHIITGKVIAVGPQEIVVTEAAWIPDTGRYNEAVATGRYDCVEMYPRAEPVIVGRSAMIDAVRIPCLPTETV